jgi:hypothetical protein
VPNCVRTLILVPVLKVLRSHGSLTVMIMGFRKKIRVTAM